MKRAFCILLALTMVFLMAPISAFAEVYPDITFNEEFLVELEAESSAWYKFVPETTRKYAVTSFDEIGVDPICKVYNSEMTLIMEGDDGFGTGSNFDFDVELTAGETYYFEFYEFNQDNAGSYSVKVSRRMPTDFWLDKYSFDCYVGSEFEPVANIYPEDDTVEITWESSDNNVATVDENGLVRLVGEGTAVITASLENGLEEYCHVSSKSSTPIYLNDVKTVMYIPKEKREEAAVFRFIPEESGVYRMYSYDIISETEDVAVDPRLWVFDNYRNEVGYNDDGGEDVNVDLQCRLEAGQTYFFMLEPYDCAAAGQITVTLVSCVSAESIKIEGGDIVAEEGDSKDIYITLSPEDCAEEDYVCTSSDSSVVRIQDKTAFFVGGGEATITVTSESGLTDSINVTVLPSVSLSLDTTVTLNCPGGEGSASEVYKRYKFTPAESGVYRFESSNIVGNLDPAVSLRDLENQLRYNYDIAEGENANFLLVYQLIAGKTYYIDVEADLDDGTEGGSVDLKVTKLDDSEIPELAPNSSVDVIIDVPAYNRYFSFTPAVSGLYRFYSTKEDGNGIDPKLEIFTENWEMYGSDDDDGGDSNFSAEVELVAGETYYIKPFAYSDDAVGSFTTNVVIVSNSGTVQTTYVEDTEIKDDEVKTLGTKYTVVGIDGVNDPALYLVGEDSLELYIELSLDDSNNVRYSFSAADFADGVSSKTFVFGAFAGDEWYYSNEFTVSYSVTMYSVSFDVNGGEGAIESTLVAKGTGYTLPENSFTAPDGMQFKAWSVDGVEKAAGDVIEINAATTVVAVWEYIVSIDTTPVEDTEIKDDEVKTLGTKYTVVGIDGVNDPALYLVGEDGFVPYASLSIDDSNNVSYSFSAADFADGVSSKTFVFGAFAGDEWYYSNEFTVSYSVTMCGISFDANGGEGTIEDTTVVKGAEYTLPENSFTAPDGMQFKAWSVDGVEKAAGDVIEINADTTVVAVWEEITVTITGDVNMDGEVDMFDYAIVKKVYFELPNFNMETYPLADVDGDGEVTPFDYLIVKKTYFNS